MDAQGGVRNTFLKKHTSWGEVKTYFGGGGEETRNIAYVCVTLHGTCTGLLRDGGKYFCWKC